MNLVLMNARVNGKDEKIRFIAHMKNYVWFKPISSHTCPVVENLPLPEDEWTYITFYFPLAIRDHVQLRITGLTSKVVEVMKVKSNKKAVLKGAVTDLVVGLGVTLILGALFWGASYGADEDVVVEKRGIKVPQKGDKKVDYIKVPAKDNPAKWNLLLMRKGTLMAHNRRILVHDFKVNGKDILVRYTGDTGRYTLEPSDLRTLRQSDIAYAGESVENVVLSHSWKVLAPDNTFAFKDNPSFKVNWSFKLSWHRV